MGKTKSRLIPLTVRLAPDIHRRLNAVIRQRPHLSINVLVNEILERELAEASRA